MASVKTGLAQDEYRTHTEPKSLGSDGKPCRRDTHGLLQRRHITPAGHIRHVGKEANQLDERQAGLAHDPEETLNEYGAPQRDDFRTLVVPVLRELPVTDVAKATGLSERTIKRVRAGGVTPHAANRAKLTAHAVHHARRELCAAALSPPRDDHAAVAQFLSRGRTADTHAKPNAGSDTTRRPHIGGSSHGKALRWSL
jgi:hypothetical protein